jgi:hypothetical protein
VTIRPPPLSLDDVRPTLIYIHKLSITMNMLNAFKLANALKISVLLFALTAYVRAIPNPPKSLVPEPTTKAKEDGAQIQDLNKLVPVLPHFRPKYYVFFQIEVREGIFLGGMYLRGGVAAGNSGIHYLKSDAHGRTLSSDSSLP